MLTISKWFLNTRYKQFLVSIAGSLAAAASNSHTAWTSPSLPSLTSDDSPVGEALTTGSLVVTLLYVGAVPSSLTVPFFIDRYGRKICLIVTGVCSLAGYIMIFFGQSVGVLYAARVVGGIGGGLSACVAPIYISELADNDIRGTISMMFVILSGVGSVFVYTVGPFISYKTLAVLGGVLSVGTSIACFIIPESPYYLAKKNEIEKAKLTLRTLAKSTASQEYIDERFLEIQSFVEEELKNTISFKELFFGKEHRKALIIIFGLMTFMVFSGVHSIAAYMGTIMNASGSSISTDIASMIFGIVQMVASIAVARIHDVLGRKSILIASSMACCIALFSEGIYFYLQEETTLNLLSISWLPITALVTFEIFVIMGPTAIPYIMMGEIFTMNAKAKAASLSTAYALVLAALMTVTFGPMSEAFGIYVTFWIYACCCGLETVFAILLLSETKGKSFSEIQCILNKSNKN